MKTVFLRYIAIGLSALILFQSCVIYQGDYSLDKAVKNEKKVKVKLKYHEYLLFKGFSYRNARTNDHEFWALIEPEGWQIKQNAILSSENITYSDIYRKEGTYYGVTDASDHNTWVQIDSNNIKSVTKTERLAYKKIVYQGGHYFGVLKGEYDMDLVPIYENEVEKVSYYDPVLSVLGSILITPLIVVLILFTPIEDDW